MGGEGKMFKFQMLSNANVEARGNQNTLIVIQSHRVQLKNAGGLPKGAEQTLKVGGRP